MMTDVAFKEWGSRCVWDGRIDDVLWKAHICHSSEQKVALKPLSDKWAGLDKSDEEELGVAVKACRSAITRGKLKAEWKIAVDETGEDKDSAYKADYWLPAAMYLNASPQIINPLLKRWPNLADLNDIYARKDVVRTRIIDLFFSSLMDDMDLWRVYEREMRMAPITYEMEKIGIRIFPERCQVLGKTCSDRLAELRAALSKIFGDFKVEVPDARLRMYLFGPKGSLNGNGIKCLGLKPLRRTEKTKLPCVDKETKEHFAESISVVNSILDFDRHQKVKAHYVDKYIAHGKPDDKGQLIIHANIRQLAATTGRMSVSAPPLHQIPKRARAGDIRKRAREPFGPRERHVWIHNDFKSIEARILGEESDDPDLIRIFADGGDPYVYLVERVSEATEICVEALDAMFEDRGGARQVCKNNFLGWTYGEGVRKLAAQMGCSYEQAVAIIHALQGAFGRVMPFMQEMQQIAKRQGCIFNRYGRKADIPPPAYKLNEDGEWERYEFWYKATNYLIQGTAADMLKESAIALAGLDHGYDRYGQRFAATAGYLRGTGASAILFIHDEIIVEVPWKLAASEKFVRGISEVMADNKGMFKKITTPVDTKVTWNAWSESEPVESLWS
jgi:DNA polymerase I-like protein with 3'-5' exonuclease and polymerase domains